MNGMPNDDQRSSGPPKLDYFGRVAERRERSWAWWFWSGLWSEVRSEFAEVPTRMLVPFVGLVLMIVVGFLYMFLAITVHVLS